MEEVPFGVEICLEINVIDEDVIVFRNNSAVGQNLQNLAMHLRPFPRPRPSDLLA
ncbi:MAG: hypothetical protein K9K86_09010 [Pseudomonadales bacterium]|nr:hypothetical protein [Pseudomonadales bacterium]